LVGKLFSVKFAKSIRKSRVVSVDLTTINDNVLFEYGFALGLGKRVWPFRDASYEKDKSIFTKLNLLEYVGWTDFRNSSEIMTKFIVDKPWGTNNEKNQIYFEPYIAQGSKLFYLKSTHNNDGSIQLTSLIKKQRIPADTIDPREGGQLSLRDYSRRISTSLGVVVHMVDPERTDSKMHNALCTFLAGMGLSMEKPVLILQEGDIKRPIDYGEVLRTYTNAKNIPLFFNKWVKEIQKNFEKSKQEDVPERSTFAKLEKLDLGDIAAENEIEALKDYFVATPTFREIDQSNDCIVSGRKGTGKTALFYEIRRKYWNKRKFIVLDLKPEGHQLKLLSEVITENFSEGVKKYLIKGFWDYVILSEIGRKILDDDNFAYQDPERLEAYKQIEKNINPLGINWEGDFAQRLLELVHHIQEKLSRVEEKDSPGKITEYLYTNDLSDLRNAISFYLSQKDGAVILVDNLDKDWKPIENISVEIDILRALADSLKALSNQFKKSSVFFKSIVFIRSDILTLLNKQTPDKGKDKIIPLNWRDGETLKQIVVERFRASGLDFEKDWNELFPEQVRGVDSLSYLIGRTQMKPRDLLTFCKLSVDTALGRGHSKISEEDILKAEKAFSDIMVEGLSDEIIDVYGNLQDVILEFIDEELPISGDQIRELISMAVGSEDGKIEEIIEVLLQYGFLGSETGNSEYSFVGIQESKLEVIERRARKFRKRNDKEEVYTVHNAFRSGLNLKDA
jgi:hypothetical protein